MKSVLGQKIKNSKAKFNSFQEVQVYIFIKVIKMCLDVILLCFNSQIVLLSARSQWDLGKQIRIFTSFFTYTNFFYIFKSCNNKEKIGLDAYLDIL